MPRLNLLLDESIMILETKYSNLMVKKYLLISPFDQQLLYISNKKIKKDYSISTSKFGIGCKNNSFKTPTGLHLVTEKIGKDMPIYTIFQGRKPLKDNLVLQDFYKDKKMSLSHFKKYDDVITSRILRLKGLEHGINLGGDVDSFSRYIYIHGTAHEDQIGERASHGCIRMKNQDIIDLFDICPLNINVLILDN